MRDIFLVILKPYWKWGVFMIEAVVGLLSFYFPNYPLFQNWQSFSVLLPIQLWLFLGIILWSVGTSIEGTKVWRNKMVRVPIIALDYHAKTDRGTAFSVTIVSESQQPINIMDVALDLENGEKILYSELYKIQINLSERPRKKLEYGDRVVFWFYLLDIKLITRDDFGPFEVVSATVIDTFDKEFKFPSTWKEKIGYSNLRKEIMNDWKENSWMLKKK